MTGRQSAGRVLALDVGGTKLAAGVVRADGTLESFRRTATEVHQGPDKVIARLVGLGRQVRADAPGPLDAVGIGCGGPLDPATGTILGPPGLPGWDEVPLVSLLSAAFEMPAYLENDGTAAALGEYRWGGWAGVRDLVYLTISTGVGGGVVLDGALRRGAAGNGGEPGHIVVDWRGRPCGCGRRGCAEAYVSGTAIARRAAEAVAADGTSSLSGRDDITARDVAVAAAAGDELAGRLWSETTEILGRVVAVLLNMFEPQLVTLGGGVTDAGRMLIDPVRRHALAQAMPPAAAAARIELSAHRDRAGVMGAAAIALDACARGETPPSEGNR